MIAHIYELALVHPVMTVVAVAMVSVIVMRVAIS
jgi:hypothetical protein